MGDAADDAERRADWEREEYGVSPHARALQKAEQAVERLKRGNRYPMDEDVAGEDELVDVAWRILCNVSEGDWTKQPEDWQRAVERFREQYHAHLTERRSGNQERETANAVVAEDGICECGHPKAAHKMLRDEQSLFRNNRCAATVTVTRPSGYDSYPCSCRDFVERGSRGGATA